MKSAASILELSQVCVIEIVVPSPLPALTLTVSSQYSLVCCEDYPQKRWASTMDSQARSFEQYGAISSSSGAVN